MRDATAPPTAPPALPAETRPCRVAAYNIHRAVGADRRRDPARIAAVIRELDADVVGLQEVDWHDGPDGADSPYEYLAHLPGYEAVAGPNLRDHRGHYGNMLLTRRPIGRVRLLDLSEPGREPRGAIDADVVAQDGMLLRVVVTHLGLGLGERRRQAARLCAETADRPEQPTLFIGDFNDWLPGSPTLRPLLEGCEATARPASFPAFLPVLALDRILARALPAAPRVRRHASALARRASDHLPLVTEV